MIGGEMRLAEELFLNLMLWLCCILFLSQLTHRNRIVLRAALALLTAVALSALCSLLPLWSTGARLLLYYVLTVAFLHVCSVAPLRSSMYCAVWVMLVSQLSAEIWLLCSLPLEQLAQGTALQWLFGVLIFGIIYLTVWRTIARWMPEGGHYRAGPRQLTSALVLLTLFEWLYQYIVYTPLASANAVYISLFISIQIYCATMLYLQQNLFQKSAMKQELALLNRLWYEQRDQYALAKETIDIINRKCHDLKHQVAAMRHISSSEEREQYLQEIENSVQIYDAIAHTGNEVLDTILTEKSLSCGAKGIAINCIADGAALSFLDPVDLYTILGNALDNAVESVQTFKEPERRLIDLLVCVERQFLIIHVLNPLDRDLNFQDGLPQSMKTQDGYHGFGLKSIRHTAEKYDGHLSVSVENGCFSLKLLIPLPESSK